MIYLTAIRLASSGSSTRLHTNNT